MSSANPTKCLLTLKLKQGIIIIFNAMFHRSTMPLIRSKFAAWDNYVLAILPPDKCISYEAVSLPLCTL